MLQTIVFFALAAVGREFFWDIESRYQILAFCVLADAVEIGRHRAGLPASISGGLASALAAAAGVLVVKWSIEGIAL